MTKQKSNLKILSEEMNRSFLTEREFLMRCLECNRELPASAFFTEKTYPAADYNRFYRLKYICKSCFSAKYGICKRCRCAFIKANSHGTDLCERCYSDMSFCADCHKELEKYQIRKRHGVIRCAECDSKAFVQQGGVQSGTVITEAEDVIVFTSKRPCPSHPSCVECVTAYAVGIEDAQKHPINIFYCSQCKLYYINNSQYLGFAKKYGLPVLKMNFKNHETYGHMDFSEWNTQSTLNFLGYNVNAGDNLSDTERRRVLVDCIEAQIMSKAKVCSFLESMLSLHEYQDNYYEACEKWESDLKFIRNYKIDKQRIINARFVLNKYSKR